MSLVLRPYQTAILDQVGAAWRAGAAAPLIQCATGSGKTAMAAEAVHRVVRRDRRAWFLVHRIELIRQTCSAFDACGQEYGVIHPRYPATPHAPVQVASIQTLTRRLVRYPEGPNLIVIDEAHHVAAATWRRVIEDYPDAYLLGLSATPSRLDGAGLGVDCGGFFDRLVNGPSIQSLIDDGFLAQPKLYASPRHLNLDNVRVQRGDFVQGDLERVMAANEVIGDAVDHYRRICDRQPALAFCVSIVHAEAVAARFRAAGYSSARIASDMSDSERAAMVGALASGDLNVMTSVDLVSEGFDVPVCAAALMLRPTQSLTIYLQQVGRALRPSPGKRFAYILDHAGNAARHGLPQEERVWTLEGRIDTDDDDGPRIGACPQCYAIVPAGTEQCPECECWLGVAPAVAASAIDARDGRGFGEGRTVAEREGELIEVTPEVIDRRREVSRARTRADLVAIAQARGYHPRWVEHVLRGRQRGH